MTPKQQRFVHEYLVDCNATQAAIRAGYSPKTANEQAGRLLVNVSVGVAIQKALAEKSKRCEIDADWVMERLQAVVERCMQSVPVLDSEGKETGVYRFDSKGANTALAHMGKHIGMFRERVELTGKDGEAMAIKSTSVMTNEEIENRLYQIITNCKLRNDAEAAKHAKQGSTP